MYCSEVCVGQARYARDKERMKAEMREHYAKNAKTKREYSRQWRKENRHRRRTQQDRRADLIESHPDFRPFGHQEWERMLRRLDYSCAYCGARGIALHQDHVVPLTRGGRHAIANILPACQPCNSSKYTYFLSEWRLLKQKAALAV